MSPVVLIRFVWAFRSTLFVTLDLTSRSRIPRLPKSTQSRRHFGFETERWNSRRYKKPPFAHNITWAKGAVHVALSRQFADYFLHNQVKLRKRHFKLCDTTIDLCSVTKRCHLVSMESWIIHFQPIDKLRYLYRWPMNWQNTSKTQRIPPSTCSIHYR